MSAPRLLTVAALSLAALPAAAPAEAANVIPKPASLELRGKGFRLAPDTRIIVTHRSPEALAVGVRLARFLRRPTSYRLPVRRPALPPTSPAIVLARTRSRSLGREGYRLRVSREAVRLSARTGQGLFRGVQTLRQLLPAKVESRSVRRGPWRVPGVRVIDRPRFAWRGAHLDVARHFFSVAKVKRYVDLIAQYKVNVLHLHLSDDQGWRLAIKSWPRLATYGGSTEIGGGRGGFYTQRDLREIVRYAAARHITLVPEIDTPGHTNAALAAYPQLNCDGRAPPLYTRIGVGFSSLCVDKPITYKFLEDVVRELARIIPGPYLHLGGDEAYSTSRDAYVRFLGRAGQIVRRAGKRLMGWEEIARAALPANSIAQHWSTATGSAAGTELARQAVSRGARLVMSPANRAYMDMKYRASTPLGLAWAGFVEVRDAYDWDPAGLIDGVRERNIAGVESALWSETIEDIDDAEYMSFPRLPGIAEIGWSRRAGRGWGEYRRRLAAQVPRWKAQGVRYYRSPQVPWGR